MSDWYMCSERVVGPGGVAPGCVQVRDGRVVGVQAAAPLGRRYTTSVSWW